MLSFNACIHSSYLACALMLRGKVNVSDVRRNIERLQSSLHFVHWNQQGWKTGLCSVPPIGQVLHCNTTCTYSNSKLFWPCQLISKVLVLPSTFLVWWEIFEDSIFVDRQSSTFCRFNFCRRARSRHYDVHTNVLI